MKYIKLPILILPTLRNDYRKIALKIENNIPDYFLKHQLRTLDEHIKSTYTEIESFILKSKKEADKQKNPLFFLIGESHFSLHSLLVDALFIIALKIHFNIHSIISEATFVTDFFKTPREIEVYSKKHPYHPLDHDTNGIGADFWITKLCNTLKINVERVDFAMKHKDNTWARSTEGMIVRNIEMAKRAKKTKEAVSIFICGAAHLMGLASYLKTKFFVQAVNNIKKDSNKKYSEAYDKKCSVYASNPKKCYQMTPLWNKKIALTPDKISDALDKFMNKEKQRVSNINNILSGLRIGLM